MPHYIDEAGRIDADRRPGRAGAHTGRPAVDLFAHVALDRVFAAGAPLEALGRFIFARPAAPAKEQPAQQARLFRRNRRHLDDAVGTVTFAITAADALI